MTFQDIGDGYRRRYDADGMQNMTILTVTQGRFGLIEGSQNKEKNSSLAEI